MPYTILPLFVLLWLLPGFFVSAKEDIPNALKEVGITEHIGETIPLDLAFVDSEGKPCILSDYFNQDMPVILLMVYFDCPMLCNLVLDGFLKGINDLKEMNVGTDYQILTVSFNPLDTPEKAAKFKAKYLKNHNRTLSNERHWEFLTGQPENITALAKSLGFAYTYDEKTLEFAHNAAIFILNDEGALSRYLYGIEYSPFDLKLSLTEAANHQWYQSVSQLLLYCYSYDPNSRKYIIQPRTVMKLGGIIFIILLAVFMLRLNQKVTSKPDSINSNS